MAAAALRLCGFALRLFFQKKKKKGGLGRFSGKLQHRYVHKGFVGSTKEKLIQVMLDRNRAGKLRGFPRPKTIPERDLALPKRKKKWKKNLESGVKWKIFFRTPAFRGGPTSIFFQKRKFSFEAVRDATRIEPRSFRMEKLQLNGVEP